MRCLLWVCMGLLGGCVVNTTQYYISQFYWRKTQTTPPPGVAPPAPVVAPPKPTPAPKPAPSAPRCGSFILPPPTTPPRTPDLRDPALSVANAVDDALLAYIHALRAHIHAERQALERAHAAYRKRCAP